MTPGWGRSVRLGVFLRAGPGAFQWAGGGLGSSLWFIQPFDLDQRRFLKHSWRLGLGPWWRVRHRFDVCSLGGGFIDAPVFTDLLEADRDPSGHPALRHGDAVELVAEAHGGLVVGDDDEVGAVEELLDHGAEPFDVRFVECRVDFVEDAERRGLALEDREQQGHGGHGLLAAGKLVDDAGFLAGRLGADLDAAFEPVGLTFLVGHQEEVRTAAAEESPEHAGGAGEVLANRVEGLLETKPAHGVQVLDERIELGAGGIDVLELLFQVLVALLEGIEFRERVEVDVAQSPDLLLELGGFDFGGLKIEVGEAVGFPLFEVPPTIPKKNQLRSNMLSYLISLILTPIPARVPNSREGKVKRFYGEAENI